MYDRGDCWGSSAGQGTFNTQSLGSVIDKSL
jgi:hypothetical protein